MKTPYMNCIKALGLLISASLLCGTAKAQQYQNGNVNPNTISRADDGWYQVQRVTDEGVVEVCAGGLFCDVTTGNYIVINHTTDVRYENIIVSGEVSDSDITVSSEWDR